MEIKEIFDYIIKFGTLLVLPILIPILNNKFKTQGKLLDNRLSNQNSELQRKIDKILKHIKDNEINEKQIKTFREKANFFINKMKVEKVRKCLNFKVDTYISFVEYCLKNIDFDNLNDFNNLENDVLTKSAEVQNFVEGILGKENVKEFFENHKDLTFIYLENVKLIFERLENHKRKDFIIKSYDYLLAFLKEFEKLDKKIW